MMDINSIGEKLSKNIGEFLVSIQTTRAVNRDAFEVIDQSAQQLARALKGVDLVPKALLNELHVTAKVLRAEAPYIKAGSPTLEEMANRIEMTFDLILRGECHDDRKPGVPRVI